MNGNRKGKAIFPATLAIVTQKGKKDKPFGLSFPSDNLLWSFAKKSFKDCKQPPLPMAGDLQGRFCVD